MNSSLRMDIFQGRTVSFREGTLLEINISHLGKMKIIFKYALSGGYVNSQEGISTDCFDCLLLTWRIRVLYQTVSNKKWLATVRMFQTHGSTSSHTDIKPSQNWRKNTQVTLNKHHHCSECAQLSLRWEKPRVKGRILFQDSQISGTNLI